MIDSKIISPMMQQWYSCKKKAGNALLLFRLGDFYESFEDDAQECSQALNITLTTKNGIPMAGIPANTLDAYVAKLIKQQKRVAIAEQVIQIDSNGKKIITRSVVHIISSGTANQFQENCTHLHLLLCVIYGTVDSNIGISLADTSTGEIWAMECATWSDCENELALYQPAEIIINESIKCHYRGDGVVPIVFPDSFFAMPNFEQLLCQHFGVHNLEGMGLSNKHHAQISIQASLNYIEDELHQSVKHIQTFKYVEITEYVKIDQATQKNLSLLQSSEEGQKFSLFSHLNHTKTPMGMRLLRNWIAKPLLQQNQIEARQDIVSDLLENSSLRKKLVSSLISVRDLERISVRLERQKTITNDMTALRTSCRTLPIIYSLCQTIPKLSQYISHLLIPIDSLVDLLEEALLEQPSPKIGDGPIFKKGWSKELDQLRETLSLAKKSLQNYQTHLRESLQIKNLKIGFTPAFGYFIEISKGSIAKVPDSLRRKQTLVNSERFSSDDLSKYEEQILKAEQKIERMETTLLIGLQEKILPYLQKIKAHGQAIALIDSFQSLAEVAARKGYVRPKVNTSYVLYIEGGRHPLIEATMLPGEFVSNSLSLDEMRSLMILTGPNMGGKSTYMRQVALLVIMAQIGSFVPAKSMVVGYIDQLFGRIGAFDALHKGQSTFMVEMIELANILRSSTSRSLLIIDEIGRGTSTYDGIAIAQATLESFLKEEKNTPRTLFSTHYRELTHLAKCYSKAFNSHVVVEEHNQSIKFLHRICEGIGAKSLGIHVAQLAGIPKNVIARAKEILLQLENQQ